MGYIPKVPDMHVAGTLLQCAIVLSHAIGIQYIQITCNLMPP
jgi:hypothetical protein